MILKIPIRLNPALVKWQAMTASMPLRIAEKVAKRFKMVELEVDANLKTGAIEVLRVNGSPVLKKDCKHPDPRHLTHSINTDSINWCPQCGAFAVAGEWQHPIGDSL